MTNIQQNHQRINPEVIETAAGPPALDAAPPPAVSPYAEAAAVFMKALDALEATLPPPVEKPDPALKPASAHIVPSPMPRTSFLLISLLISTWYFTSFVSGRTWPVNFNSPRPSARPDPGAPVQPR